MQRSGTRAGNPALREGLMMGIIVGIILLVGVLLGNLDTLAPLRTFSPLVSGLEFIIAMALYLLAGLRVSQQTGRVRTGALAGLIAGLTASLIKFTVASIFILAHLDTMRQQLLSQAPSGLERQFATTLFIIGVLLFADGIGIVVEFALGAGAGAIGGLIGKRRAPVPLPEPSLTSIFAIPRLKPSYHGSETSITGSVTLSIIQQSPDGHLTAKWILNNLGREYLCEGTITSGGNITLTSTGSRDPALQIYGSLAPDGQLEGSLYAKSKDGSSQRHSWSLA